MSSPGTATSFLSGTTPLCKGLAGVLFGGHVVVHIFPVAVTYLALIPARTIHFAWNLITAGYLEQTIHGHCRSSIPGKASSALVGVKRVCEVHIICNFLTSVCIFITAITLYHITTQETYLYTPLSSFHEILSAFHCSNEERI